MKVLVCILTISASSSFCLNAQELDWVLTMGGLGSEQLTNSATDAQGSIYSTGKYYGQNSDFDPGPNSFLMSSTESPVDEWGWAVFSSDVFISKLSSDGAFAWAKSINGKYNEAANGLAVSNLGELFVGGTFQDTIHMSPGNDEFVLIAHNEIDAFVVKLSTEGDFEWAKSYSASEGIRFNSILPLESGNVILAGQFSGQFSFVDHTNTLFSFVSAGGSDGIMLLLNVEGEILSCKVIAGDGDTSIHSVRENSQNQLLIMGNFIGTADFDLSDEFAFFSSINEGAGFILKVDSDFTFLWNKIFKGSGKVNLSSFCLDSQGNLFSTGYFKGTADFNPNSNENYFVSSPPSYLTRSFCLKLNESGDFVWAFSLGEGQATSQGRKILTDINDNLYISGLFKGQIDFNPGIGVNFMHSVGGNSINNAFVLKISNSGEFIWSKKISGSNPISVGGMLTTTDNGLLLSGTFQGTYNFDHPNFELIAPVGSSDVFIMKLNDLTVGVGSESILTPKLRCWPNPFSSYVFVQNSLNYSNNELKVFDVNGKLVYSELLYDKINKIEIGNLQKGIYFFTLNNLNAKLIKN